MVMMTCSIPSSLPVTISHEGYLEILITALGVLIAVAAIFLAILSVIGYASVKQSAVEAAERGAKGIAERIAKEEFEREFSKQVRQAVNLAVAARMDEKHSDEQAEALSRELVESKPLDIVNESARPEPKRAKTDADLERGKIDDY